MAIGWCSHCSKRQPIEQNYEGFLCCTWCGKIVEQNIFSDEPTFMKNSAGQSQFAGNYVKSIQRDCSASRERTLDNAYDFMMNVAENLGIEGGDKIVAPAKAFYTIALERNFTRGRRADQVATACLYIACRAQEKAFLLIEFAEFLGVNVYVLGAVFLQLCKLLSLEQHPIMTKLVDPSLYIHRFTNILLGQTDMNKKVKTTALSIMKSMKRDWMQTGRKPSGLCGAALYISALAHGHKFTKTDIVKIVHICEATLTKRLLEFEDTASGSLTVEELNRNAEELDRTLKSSTGMSSHRESEKVELLCEHKGSEVPHFAHGLCKKCHDEFVEISGGLEGGAEPPAFQRAERERVANIHKEKSLDANTDQSVDSGGVSTKDTGHDNAGAADNASSNSENEDDSDNFSDIDDAEVDDYLHNEEEKEYKKIIWEEMNREYLEEQAAKEAAREAEMARFQNLPEAERALRQLAADAAAKAAKSKKELRQKRAAESKTPRTAAEAAHEMLKRKKLSSRVNFDVLKDILDEPVGVDDTKKMRTEPKSSEINLSTIEEEDDDIQPSKNAEDYWGINADEDDYFERSNANDFYNEEEVYNYDDNNGDDDGSWL